MILFGACMASYVQLGSRKGDIALVIDWNLKRGIVRANVELMQGIALEKIVNGSMGMQAMVLIKRDWNNLYFLMERDTWLEGDYFKFATRLMDAQGISKP